MKAVELRSLNLLEGGLAAGRATRGTPMAASRNGSTNSLSSCSGLIPASASTSNLGGHPKAALTNGLPVVAEGSLPSSTSGGITPTAAAAAAAAAAGEVPARATTPPLPAPAAAALPPPPPDVASTAQ